MIHPPANKLFDDEPPPDPPECLYHYLKHPRAAAFREKFEKWYRAYPDGNSKKHLTFRFRDKGDHNHSGARLELTTHALLRALGFDVEVVPDGEGPDFLARRGGQSVYVECTATSGTQDEQDADTYEEQVVQAIDGVDSKYRLHPTFKEPTSSLPPTRRIQGEIKSWLQELDDDPRLAEEEFETLPSLHLKEDGLDLVVRVE